MTLIDAHGHLQFKQYDDDRAAVVARMRAAGIGIINVGTDVAESERAINLAETNDDMWATVGIHPNDPPIDFEASIKKIAELARHPRVVGIGECGLDYFRLTAEAAPTKRAQRELLAAQVELALAVGKPLMLHCRPTPDTLDAYEDLLAVFTSDFISRRGELRANVHFFVGDWLCAKKFLDLGFSFSLGGVITITDAYDEVARRLPADRLLVETDCPFVTPAPWRGRRNEPAYLSAVAERLAALRALTGEDLANLTLANTQRFFRLAN